MKAAYCLHVSIAVSKSGCKCMCLSISEILWVSDSSVDLLFVQQWDSIEIEEETDDDRVVKSNIRVPMQVLRLNLRTAFSVCHL